MVKKKPSNDNKVSLVDILALGAAVSYLLSVLTVAHHTSIWVHDGTTQTVGPPAIPALLIGLFLIAYSCYQNKFKLTTLTIIALTILATSSIFWLSGLRTNFYY